MRLTLFAKFKQSLQFVRSTRLVRIAVYSTVLFFATVSLFTYAGVAATALIRRKRDFRFPHKPLEPVWVEGNCLKIFNYGHATFKDMLEAIDDAQESIYLETYILKSDIIGQRFKAHLIRKAQEGVKVYLAFDGFGSLLMPFGFRRWPKEVNVTVYGPLHSYLSFLWLGTYTRFHRKILVIDNKTAYLGGMNLGREYATTWRDTHCRIDGPKAQEVALAFVELWNRRHWLLTSKRIHLPFRANEAPDQKIYIRESKPSKIFGNYTIRDAYLAAFEQTKSHMMLTNPYFLPDEELCGALHSALKRGVKIDLMVPEKSNHLIVDLLARPVYADLIKAGACIWLYRRTVIHSKTATFDHRLSTIGSANLDGRSQINHEINLFVHDEEFADRMEEMFRDDLKNCRPPRPDEFERPSRWRSGFELLARPVRDWV
jgi:cardiolipin synthase